MIGNKNGFVPFIFLLPLYYASTILVFKRSKHGRDYRARSLQRRCFKLQSEDSESAEHTD